MTVDSTISTSIQISSTTICPGVDIYEITWERDTTRECHDVAIVNAAIINKSTSFNITGLEANSHYTITVTANKSGIAINNSVMGMTVEIGNAHGSYDMNRQVVNLVLSSSSICPSHTSQYI